MMVELGDAHIIQEGSTYAVGRLKQIGQGE